MAHGTYETVKIERDNGLTFDPNTDDNGQIGI